MSRRNERALHRLREVAKSRGQEIREYVPRQPETGPSPESYTRDVMETPWEQEPLSPSSKRWIPEDASRTTGLNLAQRIVLVISFLVILGMTLFPPWIYVFNPSVPLREAGYVRAERTAGYHFMFADHSPLDETHLLTIFSLNPKGWERPFIFLHLFAVQLNSRQLGIQIAIAVLLTAILYFALKSTRSKATH
jgi:hypothetical protein